MRRAGLSIAAAVAVAAAVGAATAIVAHAPFDGLAAALSAAALIGGGLAIATLRAGHRALQAQIEALSGIAVELARRMTALEKRTATGPDATATSDAVDHALGEFGAVVRLLAEQVAEHDLLLGAGGGAAASARAEPQRLPAEPEADEAGLLDLRDPVPPPAAPRPPASAVSTPAAAGPAPELAARLREAVAKGRIELALRPMVGLPQRRTIHYEIASQFRDGAGTRLGDAAAARAVPRLAGAADALVLDRALRIARRLRERGRAVAVFVDLAPELWADDAAAAAIVAALGGAADLAENLVVAVGHAAFRRFGALERDLLAQLHDKGFGIALAGVEDLALDPSALRAQGVRFVKVAPPLLLAKAAAPGAAIHPDDLAGFLRRHGIQLVADPVEHEGTVAELIDIQVALVQGPLFGAARPVRPEVFAEAAGAPTAAAPRRAPEPNVGDGVGGRFARRA